MGKKVKSWYIWRSIYVHYESESETNAKIIINKNVQNAIFEFLKKCWIAKYKGRDKVAIMHKQKCNAKVKILPYGDFHGKVALKINFYKNA